MSDVAQQLLRQLIQDYGTTIVDEPRRLESLIKDYAQGQYKREVNLWLLALREGVVQELKSSQLVYDIVGARLVNKLKDEHGTDLQAAQWAVDSWALALGVEAKTNETNAPQPLPMQEQTAPKMSSHKPVFEYPIDSPIPPPRDGEMWLQTAEFHAGKTGLFSSKERGLSNLVWSPNGQFIVTAGASGGKCRVWTKSGKLQVQLNSGIFGHKDFFYCAAFQNKASQPHLAAAGHGKLAVWTEQQYINDTEQPWKEFSAFSENHFPCSLAWHPKQKNLLALSISNECSADNNSLLLWDIDKGQVVWKQLTHVSYRLAWSEDGQILAVPRFNGSGISLFDLQGQKLEIPIFKSQSTYSDKPDYHYLSWHPSGNYFVTQIHWDTIGIFETETLACLHQFPVHGRYGLGLQWSPDGRYIAVATCNDTDDLVYVFDVENARVIQEFHNAQFSAPDHGWSPDGNRLLLRAFSTGLIMVDPKTGRELAKFSTGLYANNGPSYLWNPQGTYFAFADDKGVVTVMELKF